MTLLRTYGGRVRRIGSRVRKGCCCEPVITYPMCSVCRDADSISSGSAAYLPSALTLNITSTYNQQNETADCATFLSCAAGKLNGAFTLNRLTTGSGCVWESDLLGCCLVTSTQITNLRWRATLSGASWSPTSSAYTSYASILIQLLTGFTSSTDCGSAIEPLTTNNIVRFGISNPSMNSSEVPCDELALDGNIAWNNGFSNFDLAGFPTIVSFFCAAASPPRSSIVHSSPSLSF